MKFPQFPKTRPELPSEYSEIHNKEYIENRVGGGLANKIARRLEEWMHIKVARDSLNNHEDILEYGAGNLNHVPWEKNYANYDAIEPFQKLLSRSNNILSIRNIYPSIHSLPDDIEYDRIISVAVLEHILDLPLELALLGKHLKPHGIFCAGIPTEGSIAWKLAWKYGTGISYKRRTGLNYSVIMHHEHVNTADEIISCVNYFFDHVEIKRYPLPFKHLSLYTYISATSFNIDNYYAFIRNR